MKIACIGWGSLIWNPKSLLIQNKWFEDGPILPIEFSRQSNDGRMTLIIDEDAKPVRTLWALMTVDNLKDGIESLRKREGIVLNKIYRIHFAKKDKNEEDTNQIIIRWLNEKDLDAAIWTGLSYNKEKWEGNRPTVDQVLSHLENLEYSARKTAEEYIRKAPKQIDTEYRREIEKRLGWSPLS